MDHLQEGHRASHWHWIYQTWRYRTSHSQWFQQTPSFARSSTPHDWFGLSQRSQVNKGKGTCNQVSANGRSVHMASLASMVMPTTIGGWKSLIMTSMTQNPKIGYERFTPSFDWYMCYRTVLFFPILSSYQNGVGVNKKLHASRMEKSQRQCGTSNQPRMHYVCDITLWLHNQRH